MDDSVKSILAGQRKTLAALDNQLKALEDRDIFRENNTLKETLEQLDSQYAEVSAREAAQTEENRSLKNTLHEQFFNEKAALVSRSQAKLETFFKAEEKGAQDRLTALESRVKSRLRRMLQRLEQNHAGIDEELCRKIEDLQAQADAKIYQARAEQADAAALSASEKAEYESLKAETLSDDQIQDLSRKNNIERLVGLNILNIAGVILIIIGGIAVGAYARLPDIWRAFALFALGAVLLSAGEAMNRKNPNVFSLGISSGGVGVLYAALAVSYFALEIFGHGTAGIYLALTLCAAITAAAFFLATRYNSQTLLAITLTGGYLPIFSIGSANILPFGVMGYFALLNLLALSVSFKKKWTAAAFIGMFLNIIGTAYISTLIWSQHPLYLRVVEMVYIAFAVFIYTAIPLVGTYITKSRFKKSDIVLLSVNTFFGSIIMFVNMGFSGWTYAFGFASAIFALVYLCVSLIISRVFEREKSMSALFFITGVTFAVLFVPFQFDAVWFTLGWLIQGTGLLIYGIAAGNRGFKLAGGITGGLCLAWFIIFDVMAGMLFGWGYLFAYKYFAVTFAAFFVMGTLVYRKTIFGDLARIFKYAVTVNAWVYVLFLITRLEILLRNAFPAALFDIRYLTLSLMCVSAIIFSLVLPGVKLLTDKGIKLISTVLGATGITGIFAVNVFLRPVPAGIPEHGAGIIVAAGFMLLAYSALSAYALFRITRRAVLARTMGAQYLPLIVSAYIIIISTANLVIHFGLSFASFWISVIYALAALLWIILGFVKRYAVMRQFGLGLSILSVLKFFLVDMFTLTQGFRILSYFALGIVLVAISFTYQHFSNRLARVQTDNTER